MIYVGDKKLKACYLGDDKIGKVYLGDEVFYRHVSRLPEGYKELQYISNPNFNCITNPIASSKSPFSGRKFEFVLKIKDPGTTTSEQYILGACCSYRKNTSLSYTVREHKICYYRTDQKIYVNSNSISVSDIIGDILHISVDFIEHILTINDKGPISISLSTSMEKAVAPALFGRHVLRYTYNTLNENSYSHQINCDFYSLKISNSEGILKEWVPCINPDGVVGIFDLVDGIFAAKQNADLSFTAGPAV